MAKRCRAKSSTKRKTTKRTKRTGVQAHKGTGVKTYDSFADIRL